jgi:hypothetical protein
MSMSAIDIEKFKFQFSKIKLQILVLMDQLIFSQFHYFVLIL